jgi:hypothetical protein
MQWFWSSIPPGRSAALQDHALINWFNPPGVEEHDLDPTLRADQGGNDRREVLELRVEPPIGQTALDSTDWTGVVLGPSNDYLDFTRLQAVEIWVNDFHNDHRNTHGVLRVQLGRFNEDAFWDRLHPPNGKLDTEDKNRDGRLDRPTENGRPTREYEDTGLDGLMDPSLAPSQEWAEVGSGPDPNQDDYAYDLHNAPDDYSRINNTEGNSISDANARPDTEDLNQNGALDEVNAYFEMPISLADSVFTAIDVPKTYAGYDNVTETNGWRLILLPRGAFQSVGDASWSAVQEVRFILEGLGEDLRLQVGGIRFSGIPSPLPRPALTLHQNRPNPFNPSTSIKYELRGPGQVRLEVFDVTGRLVRTLVNGLVTDGPHYSLWNGRDDLGNAVPSGAYFYRLQTPRGVEARRMVLLK